MDLEKKMESIEAPSSNDDDDDENAQIAINISKNNKQKFDKFEITK
jgi:hypothetical protein